MSESEDEIIRQRARMEWSAAAPGWKKYGKDMFKWLASVSDQLRRSAGITSGQTVLDVATGTGQPALTIAKIVGQNGKVIGVDLSPEMIEVAKEEAAHQGLTNAFFQVVKDESLSMFSDNTFDSVVCRNGLMFMPDPVKALKAILRVLKPEGKASVTVWGSPDKSPVMAVVMKAISKQVPDMKQPSAAASGRLARRRRRDCRRTSRRARARAAPPFPRASVRPRGIPPADRPRRRKSPW